MKAYQLKIAIKNSKPPIWRRCIVPAGITFSELSVILDKVMGWSGAHISEFDFYHLELRIAEGAEESTGYDYYDRAEASSTFIDEYMENNGWFTYTYDLGDDWQHRVTIEKMIPDYPLNYPQVLKFKGACPMEDCGGIEGYYACLAILSDEKHPEHGERCRWAASQGYEPEYDRTAVNEFLEKACFLNWGKREKRTRGEIYADFFKGNFGLKATKHAKNKQEPLRSSRHKTFDALKEMASMLRYVSGMGDRHDGEVTRRNLLKYMGTDGPEYGGRAAGKVVEAERGTEANLALRDIFSDFSRKDLIEIAEEKGFSHISRYSKERLVDALAKEMLKPEEVERYFTCLSREELDSLDRAVRHGNPYPEQPEDDFERLYGASYIGMTEIGLVFVPEEVKALCQTFRTGTFEEKRERRKGLLDCFEAAAVLYGIVPVKVMTELVAAESGRPVTGPELMAEAADIPDCFMNFVLRNDIYYHKQLYPDDRGLRRCQEGKEYYIPTRQEIREIGATGYLPNDRYLKKFRSFLTGRIDLDPGEARYVGMQVQCAINVGEQTQAIIDILKDSGADFDEAESLEEAVQEIGRLWNHTRMLLNRGFTPAEMVGRVVKLDKDDMNLLEQLPLNLKADGGVKKKKIYPNEPCPCGSGRKYKNCCGKGR